MPAHLAALERIKPGQGLRVNLGTGRGFSVVLADVDKFKKFNDLHGHVCGDDVLSIGALSAIADHDLTVPGDIGEKVH